MKKFVKVIVIMLMLSLATSFCFAAETHSKMNLIQPYYVGTQSIGDSFVIDSYGKASMYTYLTPKTSTSIDEVKVTLKIKNASGINIYNKTYNAEWNSLYGRYEVSKKYQLSTKGSYQFQAIYKCYKSDNLIETINGSYSMDSY